MKKTKIFIMAIMILAIYGNVVISNTDGDSVTFSLAQLEAKAQGGVDVNHGVSGEPVNGSWYPGYKMTDVQSNTNGYTQTTTTFTCGISASTHDSTVSGHASCTLQTTNHQNYQNIDCCRSTNENTACNLANESPSGC